MTEPKKSNIRRSRKSDEARGAAVRATAMETTTMAAAAMVSPDKPLTEKQRAYAVARARGESVPNAMAIAGYNEQVSYGYRLDKMPNVQRLIQQEQALYAEAAQMDRKKVEVSVNGSVHHEIHRFEAMSDDELLKLLSQGYQGGENAATPLLQAPDAP